MICGENSRMKRMLVISHSFYPESNGTISCLQNILPCLAKEFRISLICAKRGKGIMIGEECFGAQIICLCKTIDYCIMLKERIISKIFGGSMSNKDKVLLFLVKGFFYLPTILSRKFGFYYECNWKNTFFCRETKKHIADADVILAIGASFDDVRVAYEIKKQNPNKYLVLVFFDLFAFNPTYLNEDKVKNCFKQRIEEEIKWYEVADRIIVQKEMISILFESELGKYRQKIIPGFIPSINFHKYSVRRELKYPIAKSKTEEEIRVVYTGLFYEDIRNPRFTLKLFSEICRRNPFVVLHIVGFGCEDILDEYKKIMDKNLVLHGRQDKEAADDMICSANILLNISNNVKTQTPSKLMEYIGSGKPIINVYSIDEDVCEEYLTDYPLHCSIDEREKMVQGVSEQISKFIKEKQNEVCSGIEERYAQWSAEKFASLVTL